MFIRRPELPAWQGAELAMALIRSRLEQIRGALQPPRPDIISPAADEALDMLRQLEQFWASQPPGSAYFQHSHKRLPPTGGFPTQQSLVRGEQAAIDREESRRQARIQREEEEIERENQEWRGDPQA